MQYLYGCKVADTDLAFDAVWRSHCKRREIMQYVVPITQPNWLDSRANAPVDQVIYALDEASRTESAVCLSRRLPSIFPSLLPSLLLPSPSPSPPHLPNCQLLLLFNAHFLATTPLLPSLYHLVSCNAYSYSHHRVKYPIPRTDKQDG